MPAEVDRTASSYAETLAPELPETEESLFVAALVRDAISKRAGESKSPLGCLDQERLDKVVAKFARRQKRVPIAVGILTGILLALIASMVLIRAGLYAAWIGRGASDRVLTGDHLARRSGFD